MAQRRLFSLKIVDSDAFLDMPASSQLLYFHLGMRADDDGFVNPKKIMRMVSSSEDDLKVLLSKRFLLTFENGVVVIKHWLIHNTIQRDRYVPTMYIDQKNLLTTKENGAYTECLQDDNISITEVKLSKGNISKEIVTKSDIPFSLKEEIQKLEENPRRDLNIIALYFDYRKPDLQNREQYSQALKRHLKAAGALKGFTNDQIIRAIDYAKKEYKDIYTLETLLKILTK